MGERYEIKPASSNDGLLATRDSDALTKLRIYLNNESCSSCFDLRPLTSARIINERDRSGYVARLWTLNESRWTSEVKAPCYGDEPLPQRPLGNIWSDYQVDRPTKTILDKGSQAIVHDLKETQHRERCSTCECLGEIKCSKCLGFGSLYCVKCQREGVVECCQNNNCPKCNGQGFQMCVECSGKVKIDCPTCHTRGRIPCPDCKGLRFILNWTQLHVKWENHESSVIRDSGNSSILPASEIDRSSGKVTCFVMDDIWSSTQLIDSVNYGGLELPGGLLININQEYQKEHCNKAGRIIRLRYIIQRLHMREIDYVLDKKSGNTITQKDVPNHLTYFSM